MSCRLSIHWSMPRVCGQCQRSDLYSLDHAGILRHRNESSHSMPPLIRSPSHRLFLLHQSKEPVRRWSPWVPARSNPMASMIFATESPGTGVGANERSIMPNGIPNRRAASRPTSSPARAKLERELHDCLSQVLQRKIFIGMPDGVMDHAWTRNADIEHGFSFAHTMKGTGHKGIVFDRVCEANKL